MRATRTLGALCVVICLQVVAGGAEAAPAVRVAPAVVAAALPAGSVAIFDDALAPGWSNYSWGSTVSLAATSRVRSGTRSISVTYRAWGALNLHKGSALSGISAVRLAVNGGGTAIKLRLGLVRSGTSLTRVDLAPYCSGGTIPANGWTTCTVPLSALGAPISFDGVVIQEAQGTWHPTVYFDELALVPSAPTPTPAPAPAVAIAPSTTTLDACTRATFAATVTGASGGVTWSVQEGAAGGTIDGSGVYTAPSTAGTYHVVARSTASTSALAMATAVVRDRILSVAVAPGAATVAPTGQLQFAASVTTTCGTFTAVQ